MLKIDKRSAVLALALGCVLTFAVGLRGWAYSEELQGGVASQMMRFHVRANSDSDFDQTLKILVRDGVLDHFRQPLEAASTLEETRNFIAKNLDEIEAFAAALVTKEAQGFNYPVAARLSTEFFPTRAYGGVRLPAGRYETLRIDIGGAVGENWWCVMFPPLCYVDVSVSEIPEQEKETLRYILTDEEYALVTGDIQVKFKVVEWWQTVRQETEMRFARN
ncbi:MAG: stage II sporulation protein R [Defluviitaleaceae bacterium]|nr:stage II sporulation protein R [Defluviitaleaceae bacterium]